MTIYLRKTYLKGMALYQMDEAWIRGTIVRVLKQNETDNKERILYEGEPIVPSLSDEEFQSIDEAICCVCLDELT